MYEEGGSYFKQRRVVTHWLQVCGRHQVSSTCMYGGLQTEKGGRGHSLVAGVW